MKKLIAVGIAGVAWIIWSSLLHSKPVDAKKTEKSCIYCHLEYGSKELTEAGKYYKKNGSLAGYKEKEKDK
jgi:hypothetical protein